MMTPRNTIRETCLIVFLLGIDASSAMKLIQSREALGQELEAVKTQLEQDTASSNSRSEEASLSTAFYLEREKLMLQSICKRMHFEGLYSQTEVLDKMCFVAKRMGKAECLDTYN